MTIRSILGVGFFALAIAGCSSSDSPANADGAGGAGGAGGSAGSGGEAGSGGSDAGSDATTDGSTSNLSCPAVQHKTLVVIGDSISDVGGSGGPDDQEPFYRTLLVQNDDALYPSWKGYDLKTCWSLDPAANVVKVSKGGAIATEKPNSQASILLDQVKSLPATLEGPVLVVGTIGGNDVVAGLTDYLVGTPAQQQKDREDFIKGWGDAMAELTQADRFGAGVKVDVLMTNIYDPSGGSGDFTFTPEMHKCPGALAIWPANTPTDPALGPWNDAIATEAAKYPGVTVLDLHEQFKTHAVNAEASSNWFHDDCIHPNAAGHAAIRELFWAGMVGLH